MTAFATRQRYLAAAMFSALLAACGPKAPPAVDVQAEDQPADVVDAPVGGFHGVGQEPGWVLDIVPGRWLDFRYDYGQARVRTPLPDPEQEGVVTRWHVVTEAHDLDVVIEEAACNDIMSGEPFPAMVRVELDGSTYTGCGKPVNSSLPSGRYCYRNTVPSQDNAMPADVRVLSVTVEDGWVSGEYDWLPAEKDSRHGTFEGLLDGDTVRASYEFTQEGIDDRATLAIRLAPGEATVSGGPPELALEAKLAADSC